MASLIRQIVVTRAAVLTALLAAACSTMEPPMSPTETGRPGPSPEAPSTPAPAPTPDSEAAPPRARYRVTFQSTWTASTHPREFPATAHFSPIIGGVHDGSVSFWREGETASPGIREMAERGRTSTLELEILPAIASGRAARVLSGGAIDRTPGSVSLEFDIDQRQPLVTLVSMIAPSPDWFVGVTGLSLFKDGRWADDLRVDLVPWDAGTDGGATFSSPDVVTTPFQPISRIVTAPLSPGGAITPLGAFLFTRLSR